MPLVEYNVDLQPFNTFGLPGRASRLVWVRSEDDVRAVIAHPELQENKGQVYTLYKYQNAISRFQIIGGVC